MKYKIRELWDFELLKMEDISLGILNKISSESRSHMVIKQLYMHKNTGKVSERRLPFCDGYRLYAVIRYDDRHPSVTVPLIRIDKHLWYYTVKVETKFKKLSVKSSVLSSSDCGAVRE